MSSFVVEDKTINRVVSFLYHDRDRGEYCRCQLGVLGFHLQDAKEGEIEVELQRFGQAMFDLNCEAVNQRYGPGEAAKFRPLDYSFKWESWGGGQEIFSTLKALRCWLYQCSEGNVPQTELFKIMDGLADAIAYGIVCDLPDYENAEGWN